MCINASNTETLIPVTEPTKAKLYWEKKPTSFSAQLYVQHEFVPISSYPRPS